MAFSLGTLALLQTAILPGALLYKKTDFRGNLFQKAIFVFASSLMLNYMGVFLLTSLKLYVQPVALSIFVIEIILFIRLYRENLSSPVERVLSHFWNEWQKRFESLKNFSPSTNEDKTTQFLLAMVWGLSLILAIAWIWWGIKVTFHTIGTIFTQWDAVVSWNRWGSEWAQNSFPTHTWRYAQLMPTAYSIPYVFMNNTHIQFFSKAIASPFPLLILLLLLDLGLSKKEPGYIIGVSFTYLMIKKLLGYWIGSGYSDLPVSFFALFSLYLLLKNNQSNTEKTIFWGLFFAAGAAITKQPGVYLLTMYPLLVYFAILRPQYKRNWREIFRVLWKPLLLAFIIVAPWYLYKEVLFLKGLDIPETGAIVRDSSKVLQTTLPLEQMVIALLRLGKYFFLFLSLLPLLFFMDTSSRWIVLLIVYPYTLLWTQLASYDTRNLALAIPLIGMTAGVGTGKVLEKLIAKSQKMHLERVKIWVPLLLALGIFLSGQFIWGDNQLIEKQNTLQKKLFSEEVNQRLLEYVAQHPNEDIRILTNYPLQYIPGLEETGRNFSFRSLEVLQAKIENEHITHLLVPQNIPEDIRGFIEKKIANGDYEVIFTSKVWKPYTFIQIR